MRISTLAVDGSEQPVVLVPGRGFALFSVIDPSLPSSLLAALNDGLPGGLSDAASSVPDEQLIPLAGAVYRPLYRRPRKILGIGLNYRAHAADLSAPVPTEPASFLKGDHTVIGYGDTVDLPPQSTRVTAEAELGLIFGKECRNVDENEALEYIAGVCLILDQTAEDILQANPRFLTRAKNFPGFFSFGPELITMDEVFALFPSLDHIRISTTRNHSVEASATIADMIFSLPYLVSFHSKVMPFYPGDVISTGTPGATVINDGDSVECVIDGLGLFGIACAVGPGSHRPVAEPRDPDPGFAVAPPEHAPGLGDAVVAGGGHVSSIGEAEGLIWGGGDVADLKVAVEQGSHLRWVQLPSAGVDKYRAAIDSRLTWAAAKGIFDDYVAEHALGLAIAGFRHLNAGARTSVWDRRDASSLFNSHVSILGAGGISRALLRLLSPFRAHTTVIRRTRGAMDGAVKTLDLSQLAEGLRDANLVVLALPLTTETEGIIAKSQLRAMREDAWLINVGRGKLVVTPDLVEALREGWIGGAGLDVTDPEPLPSDHPLWQFENCIITPHVANPPNLELGPFSSLVTDNVRRYLRGDPLQGVVDPELGY